VEAFAKSRRHLVELGAFVDLNGLVSGVEHNPAVLAAGGVDANLLTQLRAELVVKVIR
jgi:hypothetical protein